MRAAPRSRTQIERRLVELRLAGPNLAHIDRLVQWDLGVTLGIDLIHEQLRQAPLQREQVLDIIASITGCSKDISHEAGQGYITPSATYEGLRAAAVAIGEAIEQRCSFIFATGHPRSMTEAYEELAGYVRARGCEVIAELPEGITEGDQELGLWGSVYVMKSGGEPSHTHGHEPMRELLRRVPPVGLAVADHGFGGAALNLGIPTICVMDTNDPGVALAATLGAPVTVVPLNDNAPAEDVREIAQIIIELIESPPGLNR